MPHGVQAGLSLDEKWLPFRLSRWCPKFGNLNPEFLSWEATGPDYLGGKILNTPRLGFCRRDQASALRGTRLLFSSSTLVCLG